MKKLIIASAIAMTFSATAMAEVPFQFERDLGSPDVYVMDAEGHFPNADRISVTRPSGLDELARSNPDLGGDNGSSYQSRHFSPYSGEDNYHAITSNNPDLYDGNV